jgi:hypothetical protein
VRCFLQTTPDANGATPPPPSPELFAEMGKFIEAGFSNGTLIATGIWKLVGDVSGVIQRVNGPEDLARVHPG